MKKILIVDDDSTNRYMLEILLTGHDLEVISAENGKDALWIRPISTLRN